MDVSPILDGLNKEQRDAVSATLGPTLVLAGAGSGKTRVLVHRIAWLCQVENLSPYSLLAMTFTNKAAAEMRARVESLLGSSLSGLWVGTFHGLAHRMLRSHHELAKLPQSFQILDSEDQKRLVKRLLKAWSWMKPNGQPSKCSGLLMVVKMKVCVQPIFLMMVI